MTPRPGILEQEDTSRRLEKCKSVFAERFAQRGRHRTFQRLEGGYIESSAVGVTQRQRALGNSQQVDHYTS